MLTGLVMLTLIVVMSGLVMMMGCGLMMGGGLLMVFVVPLGSSLIVGERPALAGLLTNIKAKAKFPRL